MCDIDEYVTKQGRHKRSSNLRVHWNNNNNYRLEVVLSLLLCDFGVESTE